MKKYDFVLKCGIDASTCACVYEAFSVELLQQCIIAVCIIIINVFCYPIFKCFFKCLNKKFKLGVSDKEIEKGAKDASDAVKNAVEKKEDKDCKK
jgi:hypothetical protein